MTSKAATQIESAPARKNASSVTAEVKAAFLVSNHTDLLRPFIILAEPVIDRKDAQPKASRSESRAEETDRIARGIIADETEKRDEKRRRLRAARLERNATEKPEVKPGKMVKTSKSKPRVATAATR